MASEAKIGLLLGLVIIFVVAFVLNGLPRFGDSKKNDDLTKVVDSNPIGIRPAVPREVFRPDPTPTPDEIPPAPDDGERSRYTLPRTVSPDEAANDLRPDTTDRTNEGGSEVPQPEPVREAWPKVHVVRKGENLGDIAKIYYGPKEGNRKANVMRIFESNRNQLESPHKIYPGQKIIIPSLWASGLDRRTIESIFGDSMFERVESIGRRHL